MDTSTVIFLIPSGALFSAAAWCIKRAVEMLWQLDKRVTVVETKLGLKEG
jgi:hypothetical protein